MLHNYWIDPKGKVYAVPLMGHNEWAHEYLQSVLVPDKYRQLLNSDLSALGFMIEKLKWARVIQWSKAKTPELIHYDVYGPSKLQIRSIVRYATDNNFKINIGENNEI